MTGKIVDLDAERIAQAEKEARIIELRRTGATWELIAKATGYANASGAHKAYQKALGRIIEPKIEELRATEIDRLDRLQFAIWERAKEGDIKAIDAVLRILDRRVRILGLDAPTKIQAEIVTYDGSILEEHTQRVIELVRSTRLAPSDVGSELSAPGTVTDE